jgi:Na+/melibiose symporter-like transporter
VYNWFEKLIFTMALLFSGVLLDWVGFDQALEGNQSESTVLAIRLLYALIPVTLLSIGFILVMRYPLTEDTIQKIREEMEQRRGAV